MWRGFALLLVCPLAHGQSTESKRLEFEAASLKRSAPPGNGPIRFGAPQGGPGTNDPGRITYTNATLSFLLTASYGLRRNQIVGVQQWMDSDMFDVAATVPHGATKEEANAMLQNLLADRFSLVSHRETKEMPVYALLPGKGAPKMKEAGATTPKPLEIAPQGGVRVDMGGQGCPNLRVGAGVMRNPPPSMLVTTGSRTCVMATHQTMAGLANQLGFFDRPVVDMTGLTAEYAFQLRFDPTGLTRSPGPMVPPQPDAEPFPDIFAAVQEQLGLKLEVRKAPVELLVIDHVEKTPKEN